MGDKIIGILGAMPEEINGIVALLQEKKQITKGMRTYYTGIINNVAVVVVFSRWGKVASATTVTHLIADFGITHLYFTGVAGAISKELNVGDIVIASSFVQHDMDARPIMRQFEIPLLGKIFFYPPQKCLEHAFNSVNTLIEGNVLMDLLTPEQVEMFSVSNPKVVVGQIASGDKFFANSKEKESLLKVLPEVLCVEMEGAAVAQVCFEYEIPFVIIRIISDVADESSPVDFVNFVENIASKWGVKIIQNLLE